MKPNSTVREDGKAVRLIQKSDAGGGEVRDKDQSEVKL